ncbi:shikimate kinase [Leucobacter sp. CSA1]|uniref:Shikimate kinase n=1 Tax=Leucobacter chromiisoli TaxID=2796471 RepID=A0A934Q6A1_9MICO|nr:shikimate kinase [Leucobacter chromiisoli]MBK0418165.1 shikimate kinase [Leucobacter chromiisoli]
MSTSRRAGREAGPPAARPVPAPPKPESGPITQAIPVVGPSGNRHEAGAGGGEGERSQPSRKRGRRRRRGNRLPDRAIVFVGPMAAGKTSLGKRVARELGIPFVDSDALFVQAHGPIVDFFAAHGEEEFRRIEAEVIAEELAKPGARIFALGGGAVLSERTRALLSEHPVVLLMTTQEAVLRTANISRRPLLRDDPEAWGRILAERKPLYEAVADVTYRTDRATKDQLAVRVTQWVRTQGRGAGSGTSGGRQGGGRSNRQGGARAGGARAGGARQGRTSTRKTKENPSE